MSEVPSEDGPKTPRPECSNEDTTQNSVFSPADVENVSSPEQRREAEETETVDSIPKIKYLDFTTNSFKGRVAFKSTIMTYKKEFKRFWLEFVDETGRIYAVVFIGDDGELFERLQQQKIYCITNFKVKRINKYSTTDHRFELILTNETDVVELNDDPNIPRYRYNFRTIPQLQTVEPKSRVDIIAICNEIAEVEYPLVGGEPMARCNVTFGDSLGNSIIVSFWEIDAKNIDEGIEPGKVVAIRGGKVIDNFHGRNLSIGKNAFKLILADIPEASDFLDSLGLSASSLNLN